MTGRRIEPTRSLLQGGPYTRSHDTNLRKQWAAWFESHAKPETNESIQQSAIAENSSLQVRSYKR